MSEAQQGVALALEARRRNFLDDEALALVFAYYDQEGALDPLPPEQVLGRLGGLDPTQLAALLGQPPPASDHRQLNDRLTLLEVLGEGGMGVVYRAYDRILRRIVAVKLIRSDRLEREEAQRHLARFEREARAMAKVRHAYCVSIFDTGLSPQGHPYLVMEFVAGTSLTSMIARAIDGRTNLDPRQVAGLGKAVAEGLQACHDVGVIHRDVKPANILVDSDGQPRLTDFGIALDDRDQTKLTAELAAVGTLSYLPPEQAGGGKADARSDVYALGSTLYEALTGETVFQAPLAIALLKQICSDDPAPPLSSHRPDVPRDLERVVLKCLEKDPDDRYPSAQALALDLSRYLAGEAVSARPLTPGARLLRRAWRRRRLVGVLFGMIVVVLFSAWVYSRAQAARAHERALTELATAEDSNDLDEAEAILTRLQAGDDLDISARAAAALRRLRGRKKIQEAEGAFKRYRDARQEVSRLTKQLARIELDIAKLPLTTPFKDTPAKQELLGLRDRMRIAQSKADEEFLAAGRLLAQAEVDVQPESLYRLRTELFLRRGQELTQSSPREAERALRIALEASRRANGAFADELAEGSVLVDCEPGGHYELWKYSLDRQRGHQTPKHMSRGNTPAELDLESGDYVLELSAENHFTVRRPFVVSRGRQERIRVRLPKSSVLVSHLAEELVFLPPGQPWDLRAGHRLPETNPIFMKKREVTMEEWASFMLAEGRSEADWPRVASRVYDLLFTQGRRRYPCAGIRPRSVRDYLGWLQRESRLMGVHLQVDLPDRAEYLWAKRGAFRWPFPWGWHLDESFYRTRVITAAGPAGSHPVDTSPFGVSDLFCSVSELSRSPHPHLRDMIVHFGAHLGVGRSGLLSVTDVQGAFPPSRRLENVGFRYILRPTHTRHTPPTPNPTRAQGLVAQALKHRSANRLPQAHELLTQALEADRTQPQTWYLRGYVRFQRGDQWGSLLDYSQAITLDPKFVKAYLRRGRLYLHRKEHAKAETDLDRVITMSETKHPLAWVGRGQARAAQGRYAEGIRDLRAFIRLKPLDLQVGTCRKLISEWEAKLRAQAKTGQ